MNQIGASELIINEIVSTEKDYVEDLAIIIEVRFLLPIHIYFFNSGKGNRNNINSKFF